MSDPTLLDRTLRQFRRVLRLPGPGTAGLRARVHEDLPDADLAVIREHIGACLEGRGGEVSARARAADLGELYLTLSRVGRHRFLRILNDEYGVPGERVAELIEGWQGASEANARQRLQDELRHALVPPRVTLLHQFNGLDAGVKFLVDLRAELRELRAEDAELRALDADLYELLISWFDVGFLDLKRITWNTSAALLEKLIAYEAVHAIRSWDDLKNRLGEDRRCYAFFHPRMPDEPLIFVQVALMRGIADNVQTLLDEGAPVEDPREADAAIFYSISNCQPGLSGVSFGNFLIKRVASALARDLPNLRHFATLSPIPGFRRWLDARLDDETHTFASGEPPAVLAELAEGGWAATLRAALDSAEWHLRGDLEAALRPVLLRACARYLLEAQRSDGRSLDPVAHFHLTNGARIERLNWLGDTSAQGMRQSAGMMVNYLYRLDEVERNHEAYSGEGRITAAAAVSRLLK